MPDPSPAPHGVVVAPDACGLCGTDLGSMAVLHSFERAVTLLHRGAIPADALVTHTLPLDGFAGAVAAFRRGEGLKPQVSAAAPALAAAA